MFDMVVLCRRRRRTHTPTHALSLLPGPGGPARRSHQQELGDRHGQDEAVRRHDGQRDLAKELVQADPALAGKGPPGGHEVDVALARDDGRLDVAAKGAVKGHDGVLVGREQGRLHADEDGVGGDDEQQQAGGEDDEGEQGLPDHLEVGGGAEQAQGAREREDEEGGELGGGPVDADGDPGGLERLTEGGQAVQEAQGGRGRDDDVRPSGRQLDGGQRGQQDADGARDKGDGLEEEAADVEGGAQEGGAEDAAEVGGPAGGAVQEAVDAAERGRRQGGGGLGELGGGVVGVDGVEVDGRVLGRLGVFDDGQRRVDVT